MNVIYQGKDYGIGEKEIEQVFGDVVDLGCVGDITVRTVSSTEELRHTSKQDIPAWVKGMAVEDTIYMLDPVCWDESDSTVQQILIHEICHVLTWMFCAACPAWLNEGMAMLAADQLPQGVTIDCPSNPYWKKFVRKPDYQSAALIIRRLAEEEGKREVLRRFFRTGMHYREDDWFGTKRVSAICRAYRQERRQGVVFSLLKMYRGRIAVGFIFTIAYLVTIFLIPLVSEYLIDDVLGTSSLALLRKGIVIFFVICVLQPVFGYVRDNVFLKTSEDIVYELRERMYRRMLRFEFSAFESRRKGEFLSRITNDIREISNLITGVIIAILKNSILIALIIAGMFMQSVMITSIILICFALYYLYNHFVSRKLEAISKDSLENYDDLCSAVNQSLDNILIIKTNNFLQHITEKFNNVIAKTKSINLLMGRWSNLLNTISGVIVIASLSVIYSLGALQVMRHSMTLGMVIALGLYFQQLASPIQELMTAAIQYREIRPSIRRIEEFMNVPVEQDVFEAGGNPARRAMPGTVRFDSVTFHYASEPKENKVLRNASFMFSRGVNLVYGASGEGKSTILKLIAGLYAPDAGCVVYGVPASSIEELRSHIAYVSQEVLLLNDTVYRYLTLGNDTSREEVERVCRSVGIDERIREMPQGYDSVISERMNLSGGERQRLAVARALLRKADILLLDEVTSGLDSRRKREVYRSICEAASSAVVVMVSHDPEALHYADRTYRIADGQLVLQQEDLPEPKEVCR